VGIHVLAGAIHLPGLLVHVPHQPAQPVVNVLLILAFLVGLAGTEEAHQGHTRGSEPLVLQDAGVTALATATAGEAVIEAPASIGHLVLGQPSQGLGDGSQTGVAGAIASLLGGGRPAATDAGAMP